MPKKKSSKLGRACQSCCVLIIAVIAFYFTLSFQESSGSFPMFTYIGYGIVFLCILMVIGILAGKCTPWTPSSWDDPYPMR